MKEVKKSPGILILIPAYNAAGYLPQLTERIQKALPGQDILIINDGSTDNTDDILESMNILTMKNEPNRGKGYTLNRGFNYAIKNNYDYVITIDADLQHLPEELPSFLSSETEGDIYIGTRKIDLRIMPFARWLTNNLTSLIISVFSGRRIKDSQSGYRMFAVDILRAARVRTVNYDFESEILFQAGLLGARVAEITVTTVYEESTSYINPLIDTGRFIKLIWKRIMW